MSGVRLAATAFRRPPRSILTRAHPRFRQWGGALWTNKKPCKPGLLECFRGDSGARTHVEGFADPWCAVKPPLLYHLMSNCVASVITQVRLHILYYKRGLHTRVHDHNRCRLLGSVLAMARRPAGTQPHFHLPATLPVLSINWITASGIWDDIHKTRQPICRVNFNLDNSALEPDDGANVDFGQHRAKCI
jgi:hypothetical protein